MNRSFALWIHSLIGYYFADAIKREDWETLALIINMYENIDRDLQVKKANEFLKANPTEVIIA